MVIIQSITKRIRGSHEKSTNVCLMVMMMMIMCNNKCEQIKTNNSHACILSKVIISQVFRRCQFAVV